MHNDKAMTTFSEIPSTKHLCYQFLTQTHCMGFFFWLFTSSPTVVAVKKLRHPPLLIAKIKNAFLHWSFLFFFFLRRCHDFSTQPSMLQQNKVINNEQKMNTAVGCSFAWLIFLWPCVSDMYGYSFLLQLNPLLDLNVPWQLYWHI
jgi:hypothetical protein